MAKIIDGKEISRRLKEKIKKEVEILKGRKIEVCLAVVLVGQDPASKIYVRNKEKTGWELGILSKEIFLYENITEKDLLETIKILNDDEKVNGILVQLPLPKHIEENRIIDYINPLKDVDCFNSLNFGKLICRKDFIFSPCTPAGIVELIDSTGVDVSGKNCVVVGRSNIVGKPISFLMLKKDATVSICHSKTKNLTFFTRNADILVAAVGIANFIKKDMVKEGAIVIDVGINRENKKICGDVKYDEVFDVASHITPVPGGVGPMTIAKLMENVVVAAKIQNNILN